MNAPGSRGIYKEPEPYGGGQCRQGRDGPADSLLRQLVLQAFEHFGEDGFSD